MFKEFLKKIRKYEIKIRKAVNSERYGNFHSVFKGSGLDFDDLRQYQYGDDIRAIDWNTSAKGHGTYTKIFKEEKEQTVFFIVDVSASQKVGEAGRLKIDVTKEICGVLALAAIQEASRVGLLCYSDTKERYINPLDGMKHGYRLISELYKLAPISKGTNLAGAILFALNVMRRRSLVFLISDFIDQGYEHHLKALARKHDLIVIHIFDQREIELPSLGIVPVYDEEAERTVWINTSGTLYKEQRQKSFLQKRKVLETLCRQNKADYLSLDSHEDYVPSLIRLFTVRKKK